MAKDFNHWDQMVEEGIDDHKAYFMYRGAANIYKTNLDGDIINIEILGAPELVGEMGLIDDQPSSVSALAICDTKTLMLLQSDFEELIVEYPQIGRNMLHLFTHRMRYFDEYLELLMTKSLYERIWILLQKLSPYFEEAEITLSHEEIDNLIWGSRARITEVLDRLEKEGKIVTGHRKIKLI